MSDEGGTSALLGRRGGGATPLWQGPLPQAGIRRIAALAAKVPYKSSV